MKPNPSTYYRKSDPAWNPNFGRRWAEEPMTSAELECLSDLAASVGNWKRADMLSGQAHALRQDRAP